MQESIMYKCGQCGGTIEPAEKDAAIPECCGSPMTREQKLPVCEITTTAEHARMDDIDLGEPCDDGRSGS